MERLRSAFGIAYAPVFFLGFVGGALALVADGHGLGWLGPLLLLAIGVSFAAERVAPYEPAWNRPQGDAARDVAHASVNETLSVLSIASLPLAAALLPDTGLWPQRLPLWAQLALAIVVADCGITLAHWASHRAGWLWRFHAVHHSVPRLYGFNGLMKHPLHQAFETLCGTAPLLALGMPLDVAALLGFAVAIQLLLQHANVDLRIGPLRGLWAVASGHRLHHLASEIEGDANFGLFTLVWDHLLGTAVTDRPGPVAGEVGVAGRADYPVAYVDQLLEPFRPVGP